MAGRPRDERGRFISRATAASQGIAWPTSGSRASASSSASRATPSYNSTPSYISTPSYNSTPSHISTPSYNSTSSYKSTPSHNAATTAYAPPAPVSAPSPASSSATSRPRDERGRFISREAAASQGIPWPTSGSGASISSSASSRATPSYNAATSVYVPPAPVSAPSPSSAATSRPRDEKGRFISREAAASQGIPWPSSGSVTIRSAPRTASVKPLSPVTPVQTTPHPAASRPRDEKGRFISRETAEAQGIPFPSMAGITRDEKGRFSSELKAPQAIDSHSTPTAKKATKTRSEIAKERPRDSKGRFIATEKSVTPAGGTNSRPRDSKGRFVKRLVLPPTQSDSENLPPTSESNSESTNKRSKPRDSKGRFVKLSEGAQTEPPSSDLAEKTSTKRTTKKKKTTSAESKDRPRDSKGRFVKRTETNTEADSSAWQTMAGFHSEESNDESDLINFNNDFGYPREAYYPNRDQESYGHTYYPNRDLQSTDRNQDSYDHIPPHTTLYDQPCPYTWKGLCPDGDNCPYLHQYDVANSVATQNSEESSESESSSSDSEIFIEDRGTQTEEWIAFKEYQSVIQKGNLMLQRMMGNPAINEAIRKRDPLILSDLCALFIL